MAASTERSARQTQLGAADDVTSARLGSLELTTNERQTVGCGSPTTAGLEQHSYSHTHTGSVVRHQHQQLAAAAAAQQTAPATDKTLHDYTTF